jgi:hypothetical protein
VSADPLLPKAGSARLAERRMSLARLENNLPDLFRIRLFG